MKKWILALCLCLLAVSPAMAATLGPANLAYGGDGYICSFTAPNGQEIYYISALPQADFQENEGIEYAIPSPMIDSVDANFDGVDDILVTTVVGASNAFQAIYLNVDGQYVLANHDACWQTDLPNVWFDEERQLVIAQGSNGMAGMLHDTYVFRWEGTNLRLIRRAISAYRETITQEGDRILEWSDDGLVHGTVQDYADGEQTILWQGEIDIMNASDGEVDAYLSAEDEALFSGL